MAKAQKRCKQAGGLVFILIGAVVVGLMGVVLWYWHISHVRLMVPPIVHAAEAAPSDVAGKHIYPDASAAKEDIRKALVEAKRSHKRIILDFGGDWCPDCQVLDIYFHQSPNDRLLADNFVKVNVNIGNMDRNVDVAEKYGVPLKKGVPALAVLDGSGRLLYSQKTGEFESMRRMQPGSVTEFLTKWKPRRG
jgi:thioredoxin 1